MKTINTIAVDSLIRLLQATINVPATFGAEEHKVVLSISAWNEQEREQIKTKLLQLINE